MSSFRPIPGFVIKGVLILGGNFFDDEFELTFVDMGGYSSFDEFALSALTGGSFPI